MLGVYLEQVCDHDGAVPLEPDDGDRAVEAPRHHALPPHRYHGDGPRVCAHHGAALHHTAAVLNSAVKQSSVSQSVFTTRAFSWLKAPTSAFTFKTL